MHYVEIHRARRVLTWYTLVLVAVLAITAISMLADPLAALPVESTYSARAPSFQ